ncbi:MAG: metallophosphoesterase family protein [Bacteroidetes bacterium]|nr:metallophosphoesterase family protein [Bacteroidota bacterium]
MEKNTTFSLKDIGSFKPGKLLVFGGVYSNLEALEALKQEAEKHALPADRIICTGDVVAYCADPEASVRQIIDWGIHCIAGNVEIQLRERLDDCGCNFEEDTRCDLFSRHWYPYARKNVSEAALSWMEALPHHLKFEFGGKQFLVVHGSGEGVSDYVFDSTPFGEKRKQLDAAGVDVILAGHCGLPFGESRNNKTWWNAGVIGMPANDSTQRVWYSLIEWEGAGEPIRFSHHAFTFDASRTRQKMLENNLPRAYAETLVTGLWDNCEILPEAETKARGIRLELEGKALLLPTKQLADQ